MLIKNVKSEYSTDQYTDVLLFNIEVSPEVVAEILQRKALFDELGDRLANTTVNYSPITGIESSGRTDDDNEMFFVDLGVTIGPTSFMLTLADDNDVTYETECLPYEALTKERFLLFLDDDRDIVEFEHGDDIDDFTAIYAKDLQSAQKQLLETTAQAREGFGEPGEAKSIRALKSLY